MIDVMFSPTNVRHVEKNDLAVMLASKRLAGVRPDINLTCNIYTPPPSMNKKHFLQIVVIGLRIVKLHWCKL